MEREGEMGMSRGRVCWLVLFPQLQHFEMLLEILLRYY